MAEQLLLRLLQDEADRARWLVLDAAGHPSGKTAEDPLSALVPICSGKKVWVLVPGADVFLTEAQVPARNAKDIAKALPFALEEQLSTDPSTLHFARAKRNGSEGFPVAVVSRTCMDRWVQGLADAGIRPDVMLPEPLALPLDNGAWSVLLEPEKTTARTETYSGFAAETATSTAVLKRKRGEVTGPAAVNVWIAPGVPPDAAKQLADSVGCPVEAERLEAGSLCLFAKGLADQPPLDLLQGDYAQKSKGPNPLRTWWPAAALLLMAVATHLGFTGYQALVLEKEHREATHKTQALFRELFPEIRRLVNPRVQAEQALAVLRARQSDGVNDGFLPMFYRVGKSVHEDEQLSLNGFAYQDGVFNLRLSATELSAIERCKQKLDTQSLASEVLSVQSTPAGVDGQVRVVKRPS